MLTLDSRTYLKRAGAVVAVAVVTFGLYATDPWQLGGAHGGTYLANADAPIAVMLPEIEVVAAPIEWQ